MKKVILTILTLCLFMGISLPAYAIDEINPDMTGQEEAQTQEPTQEEDQSEDQHEPQGPPVVVSTLKELQTAIDDAEDGDTIYFSKDIWLNDVSLICDKDITIRGLEQVRNLFYLSGDCVLSGFNFIVDGRGSTVALIENNSFRVCNIKISDCRFLGDGNDNNYLLNIFSGNVEILDCTFQNKAFASISIGNKSTVMIKGCFFNGTQTLYLGGAICNYGDLTIYNTEIVNNASGKGGAIYNDGLLTISSSTIKGNTGKNEFDVVEGNDIYSCGVLTITDEQPEGAGFYEETTGEKLTLPLVGYANTARLTYLTEEQAAEYFAPEPPQEEKPTQLEPGDNGDGEDTPTEQPQPPQQPGDQTGDNDTADEEQPPQKPTQPPEANPDDGEQGQPQEPVQPPQDNPTELPTEPEQPPEGEGKDDPTENPPEAPEQPVEPPKDDTTDTPTTTPDTPQQPQEPADGNNGNNDNYTPPTDYYPIYRPLWPVVTVKPTEDSKPQTQPDNIPAPAKSQLVCNGAVIDTSRTVVLLGYGDGLIHENDPLTRAQLATIIYRLLDDASIAKYSNSVMTFSDVAADAWYALYVRVIQAAGIVNGVGGGRYDPNGTVTWAQIITILTHFVEPKECNLQHIQYQGWAQEAIKTAVALDWIEDRADFTPDAVISRGQLEQLINSVLALYR